MYNALFIIIVYLYSEFDFLSCHRKSAPFYSFGLGPQHVLIRPCMHPNPSLTKTNCFKCLRVSANLIRMFTRNKLGRKWPTYSIFTVTANREFWLKRLVDISFAPISGSNLSRIAISVSKCMFWGLENPIKVILTRYLHSILVNFLYQIDLEFKVIFLCCESTKVFFHTHAFLLEKI